MMRELIIETHHTREYDDILMCVGWRWDEAAANGTAVAAWPLQRTAAAP
jgi:hypothetical protein